MDFQDVLFERRGPIAWITLNRPEKLNAITWRMIDEIIKFCQDVGRDDDVRCVVFTGAGRAFSAGDDIVGGMGERPGAPPMASGQPATLTREFGPHYHMTRTLMSMPKPVVAAINGPCHGAGWVIALSCDFRVMRGDALIGDIRSRRSIFAGQLAPLLLPRLIGQSRAMDLLMTGRVIDAAEAERYGIVTRVWPAETWDQELQTFLDELASGPTKNYAAWKFAVNRSVLLEAEGYAEYERFLNVAHRATEDSREGVASFREKRDPKYTGR
ncbi:MAG TPA: enoyl-CoA hydratase/isomerase family protein [Dehalococcoidia bacterium]|nr:enoyl-CoA hydratase/isomerase family protein [Dehalococcoidia bacterium]